MACPRLRQPPNSRTGRDVALHPLRRRRPRHHHRTPAAARQSTAPQHRHASAVRGAGPTGPHRVARGAATTRRPPSSIHDGINEAMSLMGADIMAADGAATFRRHHHQTLPSGRCRHPRLRPRTPKTLEGRGTGRLRLRSTKATPSTAPASCSTTSNPSGADYAASPTSTSPKTGPASSAPKASRRSCPATRSSEPWWSTPARQARTS